MENVHGKNSLMRKPVFNTMGHALGFIIIYIPQEKKLKVDAPKKPSVAGSHALTAGAISRVTSDPMNLLGSNIFPSGKLIGLVANSRSFQGFRFHWHHCETSPGATALKGMPSKPGILTGGGVATARKAKAKPKASPVEILTVPASSLPEA